MIIWLAQYLCPQRHALCGVAYEPATTTPAEVEATIRDQMAESGLRHVCGLCGATTLHFEHRQTVFTDWETAMTALKASERDQMRSRAILELAKNAKN